MRVLASWSDYMSKYTASEIGEIIVGLIIILLFVGGGIFGGVTMIRTGSNNTPGIIACFAIPAVFICFLIHSILEERQFKLRNSRQFVMSFDTACDHRISDVDKNGFVTMEYYGKKYKYKVIRQASKNFTWAENHHTCHRTGYYLILEKTSDSQPPNYGHMAEMREKELKKKG